MAVPAFTTILKLQAPSFDTNLHTLSHSAQHLTSLSQSPSLRLSVSDPYTPA